MKVLFRCDGSTDMGLGHLFRCKTLAKRLIENNVECMFVLRLHEHKNYYSKIMGTIPTIFLDSNIKPIPDDNNNPCAIKETWLGVSQQKEIKDLIEIISNYKADLLIVDHYAYDHQITSTLNYHTTLVVVDDLSNRALHCDFIINHNLGVNEEDYSNCKTRNDEIPCLLLGPKYCLIEKKFSDVKTKKNVHKNKIINVLISFGALDHSNFSFCVLNAIANSHLLECLNIAVMLHSNAPYRLKLEKWSSEFLPSIKFHWSPKDIPELYSEACFAIGAGGTSAWERCASGLPSLMLPTAANQEKIIQVITEAGGGKKVSLKDDNHDYFLNAVQEILENKSLLNNMSYNARKIIDGHGVDRITDELLKYAS